MKKRLSVLYVLPFLLLASCGSDSNVVPDQREAIIKYLEAKKSAAEGREESYVYTEHGGVFRHIANSDRDGYSESETAERGDSVMLDFEAYTFTSGLNPVTSNGDRVNLYYTNKWYIEPDSGLDWDRSEVKVKLGATPMIEGLNRGLPGCREGDSVLLFITSNLAYGKKPAGVLDHNQAIVYIVNINDVKK